MSAARNEALVRQAVHELWNDGDLDVADAVFAPTYVNHDGLITDLVAGPEAVKVSVALLRTAFPHLRVTIDQVLAEGDAVALRWTARGGRVAGDGRAAGEAGTLSGMTVGRVADGQIVETWMCWDPTVLRRRWPLGSGHAGSR